jgi:23S rRNA (adenine2503-C2)-methyltransferase
MKVIAFTGDKDIAMVYIVEMGKDRLVECVEAVQPPISRDKKWVLLISTMYGCPVGCKMCDAGGFYHGKLTKEEIFSQIDYLVQQRYPDGQIPSDQFKIQFARMGEPALNDQVLEVLTELPTRYQAPGLMPSLSTVAPIGMDGFFNRLREIKDTYYGQGQFQFQFSIHTTDEKLRDEIIPVKKWGFAAMAAFGERFFAPGDRKITLNFALAQDNPVDSILLREYFNPDKFLIKITPLNPTYRARENQLTTYVDPNLAHKKYQLIDELKSAGYQVIISIGEPEENLIGSNCGQYVRRHLAEHTPIADGYTYQLLQKNQ